MFIQKNFNFRGIMSFSGGHIVWMTCWAVVVVLIYEYTPFQFNIPWLPLSIVATAVAFYVGFKNNSSYDRLWEARKIWGAIVNSSRMWGSNIKSLVSNQFKNDPVADKALHDIHQRLIYRHIAWLYTLRNQLLIPTPWEHINQNKHVRKITLKRMERFGTNLDNDGEIEATLSKFLDEKEMRQLVAHQNTATQIIDKQSSELKELRQNDLIDDFRHIALQDILNDFYTHQGKCERIKKFPFPRQYGGTSFVFIVIFIFLLPFGLVSEFAQLGEMGSWLSIPFTVLVGWVYLMMELVGDYSENPFEGMGNDIPMRSLCRVIEIDLREMLGETDLPPAIQAKNGVLM